MKTSKKAEMLCVKPLSMKAKERFENDMNRLHSCRVDKREHGKMYLSSISRRYAFEMFEGGDDNWEIIN